MALGLLECSLSFIALSQGEVLAIGAWLVFKVGTKWAVWQHIVRPPDMFPEIGVLDSFRVRSVLATTTQLRFLVGTLLNITLGVLGIFVAVLARQ